MRGLDGQIYDFSATPTGDKLFVKPYRGDFGTLEVRAGGRQIDKLGVAGLLYSDKRGLVEFGVTKGEEALSPTHRLPVGDYRVYVLSMDFGRLTFTLRSLDEAWIRMGRSGRQPPLFPIKIRADKPCVLDFSATPVVRFASPGKGQTFKPCETVKIEALLIDPDLDVLFGGITDTTVKVGELTYKDGQGKTITRPRYAVLDPTVEITDSSGKKVADGTMPFG